MKLAYLITAFANFEHLARLVKSLDDENVEFYIHTDKKSQIAEDLIKAPNIHYIPRIKVWWGGFSHLQAILNLMAEALTQQPDYLILISGGDYPIRKKSELYNLLQKGGEFINIEKGFSAAKPEARVKYFYFDQFDRRAKSLRTQFFFFLEKLLRRLYTKKNYPFQQVYHGSTWWALSKNSADYILRYLAENPGFLKFFRHSWCPEECLPHTIIGNSNFMENVRHDLTYTDWSVKPGPANIDAGHIELFKSQKKFQTRSGIVEPFFARKFNDHSAALTEIIDRELRS